METGIISDNNLIHVEHILPRKIRHADEWKIDIDKHGEYLNRFGKLTLLGQEYNRNAVNKYFVKKKKIYQQSEISMTQDLLKYSTWTGKRIEERQRNLAKIAIEIWKKI